MLRPMKGFENFTYEFLNSITFKKDRMNFDNPDHRVSFRLMNIDYEMSLENFCNEMGIRVLLVKLSISTLKTFLKTLENLASQPNLICSTT